MNARPRQAPALTRAKPQQRERQGQSLFFAKLRLHRDTKHLPIFAIANGGHRNVIEATNLKRSGVVAGVPDICVAVPSGDSHGLWLECKIGKGALSEAQRDVGAALVLQGYRVLVVRGDTPIDLANALWDALRRYLNLMDD